MEKKKLYSFNTESVKFKDNLPSLKYIKLG